jgi:hypothetical protein
VDPLEVEDRRDAVQELEAAADILLSYLCYPEPGFEDEIEHYQRRIQLLRHRLSR